MLNDVIQQVWEECDCLLTKEQLDIIRQHMANYSLCAAMDSDIASEAAKEL